MEFLVNSVLMFEKGPTNKHLMILFIIGVDNTKWYKQFKSGPGPSKLSRIKEDFSFEERETIFEENRQELMSVFRWRKLSFYLRLCLKLSWVPKDLLKLIFFYRTSKKAIQNVCRGFFADARHLEKMFEFLSGISLRPAIEDSFKQQIGT